MDIEDIKVYQSPNVFSLKHPVVKLKVRLGELADVPTNKISGLNNSIIELFPGLEEHRCSTGYVGGFLDRLAEGTYLAHVAEHLCLEVQKVLGYDIKYGKARQISDDLYNIIYTCGHPMVGKACGIFIVNSLNQLIQGNHLEFENEFKKLKNLCVKYDYGASTSAIVTEAKKRGIPVSEISDSGMIRLGYGKYQKYISATLYEGTSSIAVDIACDKALTKALLEEVSIPVPSGQVCTSAKEAALEVEKLGYPVVVKPKSGNQGKQVFTNINNVDELKSAFMKVKAYDEEVMVEKYVVGRDYRILVVNGKMVAVAERVPAHVIGDGIHTVKELIDKENGNILRGEDHEKPLTKIKLDEQTDSILSKQGLHLPDIASPGQVIWLRANGNLSTGGTAVDCTDIVHVKNKEMAELAAKTIGLDIAGIDMVIPDITRPVSEGYGAIVEVNAAPGIRMHLAPTKGVKRDVASSILDMIYPEGSPHTIPIVSITGTNGKTTTTRMISYIFKQAGKVVGTTTTHGIYIHDKCIEEGDTTGPRSAKRVLNNREIEVAVLETARGGMVREGLAYEKADVAVFTNLSEDHLGIDEVDTMEDLLHVKSLVIEAVKENGACVLNADDPWVMMAKERTRGRVLLYSIDWNNPYIINHIKAKERAIYKKDNSLYVSDKGVTFKLMDIDEIPATLKGNLKHNIYNSMAAAGACYALGVPMGMIKDSLSRFTCDANVNPGRFNVFDLGQIKVVLDYGHNIDGYHVTIEGLRSLSPSRLIGIIGVPGDRRDADIKNIGRLSGNSFDYIIIKEDDDLRGRKSLEAANILLEGILEAGMPRELTTIIPQERLALEQAIRQAQSGDVIVMFFEKMEPLVKLLESYKSRTVDNSSIDKIPVLV
ncbi:cyanophycin synthetase [Petroclostridium sp. X23]|uniref:cyanophycin synthetase n=1 Tax=Petroclostridium sp. X23 TaxID=3045146 RepID=UPI0024AD9386|nr:cyanophycin synthetase [Petroclostridium sp. X23]WHH60038.1 cyanophycin synthetase [Petroclostridium sp. X23]